MRRGGVWRYMRISPPPSHIVRGSRLIFGRSPSRARVPVRDRRRPGRVARAGGAGYSADWWTPTACSVLLREELEGLLDELLVVLEDSAVPGVRVDHQLVVRQTSGHVEGVRRRQHPVVIAVREEYGLADA